MTNNNQIVVPEAKNAMEQFKMQAASEVGVPLKQGYNGDGQEDDRILRKLDEISGGMLPLPDRDSRHTLSRNN